MERTLEGWSTMFIERKSSYKVRTDQGAYEMIVVESRDSVGARLSDFQAVHATSSGVELRFLQIDPGSFNHEDKTVEAVLQVKVTLTADTFVDFAALVERNRRDVVAARESADTGTPEPAPRSTQEGDGA